jgi:hypothetical protein
VYKTDNGLGPRQDRLPAAGGRAATRPSLVQRLIADGIAEADSRGTIIDHITARQLAISLAARPRAPDFAHGWSASSKLERSTPTSRPSCASTPGRAGTPTSRKPPIS